MCGICTKVPAAAILPARQERSENTRRTRTTGRETRTLNSDTHIMGFARSEALPERVIGITMMVAGLAGVAEAAQAA